MTESNPKSLSLLLIDDSETLRRWWKEVLSRIDGINIVAEATNAAEAISLFQSAHPDTVLLDVELGREDGFNVLRHIRERDPACFIIAVSSHRDAVYERMSYELGANHYVAKLDSIDGMIVVLKARLGR